MFVAIIDTMVAIDTVEQLYYATVVLVNTVT